MTGEPTKRQAEYLAFIRSFTERWGIPPSFDDIGRHFDTTPPSVNSMFKMLEARGFLARVPGAARTLRVLVPGVAAPNGGSKGTSELAQAVEIASLIIERLVPALADTDARQIARALDAVAAAVDIEGRAAGSTEAERDKAKASLHRVARAALGITGGTPGRPRREWRSRR